MLEVLLSFYFLVVVKMSVLMRNFCRQVCPWVVGAFRQCQGWMSQNAHGSVFSYIQVSRPHRNIPPYPAGSYALKQIHNWITKPLIHHIHMISLTFSIHLLSFSHVLTYLPFCRPVFLQCYTQSCMCHVIKSLRQHTVHFFTCPHKSSPAHTDICSHLRPHISHHFPLFLSIFRFFSPQVSLIIVDILVLD